MSQIKGTFISFTEKVNEQKGAKAYDFFKVRYVDEQGNQKVYSGFYNALKFNRELASQLRKLQQNDQIILVMGENKAGYPELQSVSVIKSDIKVGGVVASGGTYQKDAPQAARSYQGETAEERAKRQILIVKQSSLSSAVETVKQDKKVPSTEEVLSVAQEYFDWVMGNTQQQESDKPKPAAQGPTIDLNDDLQDDVPF